MFRHIAMPFDFRLSAWPYGGDNYTLTYSTDKYLIDFRHVLDYVEQQLLKIAPAFVLKTTFTLVNIYDEFTDLSTGLSLPPDKSVRRTPLTFTFARTLSNDGSVKPAVTQWWSQYSAVWGPATNKMSDFITISIPLDILTQARIQQLVERDQRAFYNIAGGFTKAVIRRIHESNLALSSMSKFKHYTIPRAMFYVSINEWCYVLDFWKRYPDLLKIDWSAKFLEYYCREIAPDLPDRRRSKYYAQFEEEAQDRLRQFILRYLQNKVMPDEANLISLLPMDDLIIHDVETLVRNLSMGIIE